MNALGRDILDLTAEQRLLRALRDIFYRGRSFKAVVYACCAAQRALAAEPEVRDCAINSGWIVGKADDHNI